MKYPSSTPASLYSPSPKLRQTVDPHRKTSFHQSSRDWSWFALCCMGSMGNSKNHKPRGKTQTEFQNRFSLDDNWFDFLDIYNWKLELIIPSNVRHQELKYTPSFLGFELWSRYIGVVFYGKEMGLDLPGRILIVLEIILWQFGQPSSLGWVEVFGFTTCKIQLV